MLTRIAIFPKFFRKFKTNTLDVYNWRLLKCRNLHHSSFLFKKQEETDAERLEREAPFLFKAIKNKKNKSTENKVSNCEEPIIFRPIKVKKSDVEDDLSHFVYDTKLSQKKENVYVIQPNIKWGKDKILKIMLKYRVDEAEELIESVTSWNVYTSSIEPVQEENPRFFFGSGKVLELSEKIRDAINNDAVTMVFLNTGRLSLRQIKELEAIWGCKVFDRYRVVLELFKERAITKEAKLQVHLAEIQYMRTHLVTDNLDFDQQQGGSANQKGPGETQIEKSRRKLSDDEHKTRKALRQIRSHRSLLKSNRIKQRVTHVAMIGYTNAGKTTLTKALSQDNSLIARDQLFATLDTTAHQGKLPSGLNLVYIDTVGFISDLPHELVESFSTTLGDVITSDLLIHVADCSHPEFKLQYETVENVLDNLNVPEKSLRNKITVLNKVDLGPKTLEIPKNAICISASSGFGIENLRHEIQRKILSITGRKSFWINVDLHGDVLSWLFHNGTVTNTAPREDGTLDVNVLLEHAMKNKFEKEYKMKLEEV